MYTVSWSEGLDVAVVPPTGNNPICLFPFVVPANKFFMSKSKYKI